MRHRSLGYTGHLFEEEVLSHCLFDWDGTTYYPFGKAMRLVRDNQPWDPGSPTKSWARVAHRRVAMALGVEDWKELELFTAVGSPLDFFHGVDAFFLWAGFVVTIDVTTNPEKDIGKADIIYHEGDRMDGFVKRVVDEFNEKKLSQSHAR